MIKLTAVALQYNHNIDDVPIISAQGQQLIAKEMQSIARRYGVQIHKNEKIVSATKGIECNSNIPQSIYYEVAKIIHGLKK